MQNSSYPLQFTLSDGSVYAEWADYSGKEYQASAPLSDFLECLQAAHQPETAQMRVEHGGRMINMEVVIMRDLDSYDPEREVKTVLSVKDWFDNCLEHSAKVYAFNRLMGF